MRSGQSTARGYPKISESLIEALNELAKEVRSISLLRYVDDLREANAMIGPENASSDSKAIQHGLKNLPDLQIQKKIVQRLILSRIARWLIIAVLAWVAVQALKWNS